jgi:hypothetical protein
VLLRGRLFLQAAQPLAECAAPDPHPASRQPHQRRAGSLPAPAVERGPGYPQLGGHLLDRQQRVARGSGLVGWGGGGPAGSGLGSRGRLVRGSATTDAPLRPACQVRRRPGRRRQAASPGGRPWRGQEERPRGLAARRGWRAARPCRWGRPAGAGAGWSRAVTSCAPSPLPGAVAAGPDADRRGGLACRPGPQASSLHSGRRVKSPGTGAGLTRGPEPRVDTGRRPHGQEGATLGEDRLRGGCRGGTMARTAKVRATVIDAPAAGYPGEGAPGSAHRVLLTDRSGMAGLVPRAAAFLALTLYKSGFGGFFSPAPRKSVTRVAGRHGCRGSAEDVGSTAYLSVSVCRLHGHLSVTEWRCQLRPPSVSDLGCLPADGTRLSSTCFSPMGHQAL